MKRSKLATFVGFAVKSASVLFGEEAIGRHPDRVKAVLTDVCAPEKLKARVVGHTGDSVPVFEVERLSELVHRDNVKAIGITDKPLADAVINLLR